ncbi:MAG: hypothetical protein H6716_28285 [Polyangiaceae bacterium]|nr:hypothetical protein [Polyangiaceae bacterium]
MGRKALNTGYGFNFDGSGVLPSAVETNATKIDDTLAELDKDVVVVALSAGGTATLFVAKPTARTLAGVRGKRHDELASALGDITLAILDGDGTTLLSTASVDAKALTAAFAALTLTDTSANLDLAAGEPLEVRLVSTNGDATGGPAVVELTWAAE